MSDRLPKEPRAARAAVVPREGSAEGDPGVNGQGGGGAVGRDAPAASGLRFLPVNGVLGSSDPADDVDSDFQSRFPAVWEFVTCREFKGHPRMTATLLFFREDGQWKLCVGDRDTDRVLFRSGDSLSECLEAAEKALASPRADWRASRRSRSR